MAAVIASWIYIGLVCMLTGVGILCLLTGLINWKGRKEDCSFSMTRILIAGIIGITVYAEIFSIFGKIGAPAHGLALVMAAAAGIAGRKVLIRLWEKYKPVFFSWEGFFYVCFIVLIAFFTSRGAFHTDTNIYHAQTIRLYEEYGLIKGMGNLQLHFAYNSSYLAFASVFSLQWLFGRSLHTTTGLIEVIMCLYAFHGLKDFMQHRSHLTDMMRIGILFYTLVIITGSISPATDYVTMYFALFIITAWCENSEGKRSISSYGLLSVAAVFTLTLKFSACLLSLLAVYPAVYLVKEKRWREIGLYLGCGIMIVIPFLVRNYLISGWLLYPFNGIDIFGVEWKVPEEYLLVDADQIKVWGRCLYDVTKVDWPVFRWLPVWWEGQERYEQMLMGAVLAGSFLLLVQFVAKRIGRKKIRWELITLVGVIYACLGLWFFMAPFIRYGLSFLLAVPLLAVGEYLSEKKRGFYSILTGSVVFCIVMSLSPYWDRYITDAGVFIKQNILKPYYLVQKDYDQAEEDYYEINGNRIYYSVAGEVNSYHVFPGTCYEFMLERSTLMGDNIKDGFKAK